MLTLESPLSELSLNTKELNALSWFDITNVAGFLQLDLYRVLDLKGYGEITFSKLKQYRESLVAELGLSTHVDPRLPAERFTLASDIRALNLNKRGLNALRMMAVKTVQDFLEIDHEEFSLLSHCGPRTIVYLRQIQAELRKALADEIPPTTTDLSLLAPLGLNRQGLKTLQHLNIRSILDFLHFDLSSTDYVAYGNLSTRKKLQKIQTRLLQTFGVDLAKEVRSPELAAFFRKRQQRIHDFFRQPLAEDSWKKLPLFSDHIIPDFSPADLHPSYRAETSLADFSSTEVVKRAVAKLAISSLGDLLLTPGAKLKGQPDFGRGVLPRAQAEVAEFFQNSLQNSTSQEVDTSTPGNFLCSLLTPIIRDDRQRRVLLDRMGWQTEPQTLAAIAKNLGLTRERIHKIEKAALQKLFSWKAAYALKPLHDPIVTILKEITPLLSIDAVSQIFQQLYEWPKPLAKQALTVLLPVFKDLRCLENQFLCLDSFRCHDCPRLPIVFENLLETTTAKKIELAVFARRFHAQLCEMEECQQCSCRPTTSSINVVHLAFLRSPAAQNSFAWLGQELRAAKRPRQK